MLRTQIGSTAVHVQDWRSCEQRGIGKVPRLWRLGLTPANRPLQLRSAQIGSTAVLDDPVELGSRAVSLVNRFVNLRSDQFFG